MTTLRAITSAGRPIGILVGAVLVTALGLLRASRAQADTYAGGFGGLSRVDNQIVDVDGFANWGHPGAVL